MNIRYIYIPMENYLKISLIKKFNRKYLSNEVYHLPKEILVFQNCILKNIIHIKKNTQDFQRYVKKCLILKKKTLKVFKCFNSNKKWTTEQNNIKFKAI